MKSITDTGRIVTSLDRAGFQLQNSFFLLILRLGSSNVADPFDLKEQSPRNNYGWPESIIIMLIARIFLILSRHPSLSAIALGKSFRRQLFQNLNEEFIDI